ncbi:MAG TPA: hypothetical protein V6C69_03125 [Trichormus sp.]
MKKIIGSLAVIGATVIGPSLAMPHPDEGGLGVVGDALQEEGGKDQTLCEKVTYSPEYDRWLKDYLAGNFAAAQKDWKGVINQMVGAEDIRPLIRLTNSRLAFADQPPGATGDRLNIEACDKVILDSTLKEVGSDNLMVLSARWFVSSLNKKPKNEQSAGIVYLKARMAVHEKAWGAYDSRLIGEYVFIARIYAEQLKNYKQAALYAEKVAVVAKRNRDAATVLHAIKFRDKMNKLTVSQQGVKH